MVVNLFDLKGLMMLTNRELYALNAILEVAMIKSKEEDDGDPVFHEVSVEAVNPFDEKSIRSAVYTSLVNKGLIQCSGTEDESGDVEYVCITQDGLEALKAAGGVH